MFGNDLRKALSIKTFTQWQLSNTVLSWLSCSSTNRFLFKCYGLPAARQAREVVDCGHPPSPKIITVLSTMFLRPLDLSKTAHVYTDAALAEKPLVQIPEPSAQARSIPRRTKSSALLFVCSQASIVLTNRAFIK